MQDRTGKRTIFSEYRQNPSPLGTQGTADTNGSEPAEYTGYPCRAATNGTNRPDHQGIALRLMDGRCVGRHDTTGFVADTPLNGYPSDDNVISSSHQPHTRQWTLKVT